MTEKEKKADAVATVDHTYPALANPNVCALIEQTVEVMGITPWQLGQIRVPTGGNLAWTIDTGNGPDACKEFSGIIGLAKAKQRAWYRESFSDTGGGSPPSCTSADGRNGFGVNDPNSPPDTHPTSYSCASCEWNQFGSKRGPGRGKDCAEVMHLYIWLPGEALPAVLQVPPTSLQAVQGYMLKLASKFQMPQSVMTRFGLKIRSGKGVPDSSTLVLSIERLLTEEEQQNMGRIADTMKALVPFLYPSVSPDVM